MPQAQKLSPLSQGIKNIKGIKQIGRIKAAEFDIIDVANPKNGEMQGYRNREDISTLPPNTLVVGSQDVLTNTFGRIYSRSGYALDGASSGINIGIVSSFDWFTPHGGGVRNLRAAGLTTSGSGYVEVRNVDSTGKVTWNKLLKNLTSVSFNFAEWWNNSQQITELLMVNGGQQIYDWNGGIATVSTTSDTASAVMSIASSPVAGGTGYVVGDTLTISGGTGATVSVNSIVNGAISTSILSNGGSGYNNGDVLSVGGSGGIGATVTVTGVAGNVITSYTLTTAGQNYPVGMAYLSTGTNAAAKQPAVINITAILNGVIGVDQTLGNPTALTLLTPGTGYSTGTQNTTGGTGSGATVNVTALSQNTITVQGSKTIGQLGFYNDTNTHRLIINGQTFSYSSSASNSNSKSFLGVTPDPTTASLTAGMLIMQAPEITPNTGGSNLPLNSTSSFTNWTNDLIEVLKNQVYVGCLSNNTVFVSKINSLTDFTFSSPRLPGEGALFIFDAPLVGLKPQESDMYFSCGTGFWYVTQFTLSADLTKEALKITPLKTGLKQGVFSQALMWKTPNDIAFVTNEPVVRTLGRVDMIFGTPQMTNLSASIVNDVSSYNFAGGSGKFFDEFLFIAVPTKGIIRMYNMTSQDEGKKNFYWEAPQTIPLSGFMDTGDGNIYGHSCLTSDSYKLFSGSSDNGNQINSIAAFPQITFGTRHKSKSFIKEYVEGYLSQSTTLTCQLNFIDTNKTTTLTKKVLGTNSAITNNAMENASIGKTSLGQNPIGGDLVQPGTILSPNFATYLTFQRTPFFKVQPIFSSLGTSQSWQLLAIGFNQQTTSEGEVSITI